MSEEQKNLGMQPNNKVNVASGAVSAQNKFGVNMVQYTQDADGSYHAEVTTLDPELAMQLYPPIIQQDIMELVDLMDFSNPEHYQRFLEFGDVAMEKTLGNANEILETFSGSETDETVFGELLEIIKTTDGAKSDFEGTLKKVERRADNPLWKIANRVSKNTLLKRERKKLGKKLGKKASDTLLLLKEFAKVSDDAKQELVENSTKIGVAESSDRSAVSRLEQYIVAGFLALKKCQPLLDAAKDSTIFSGGIVESVTESDIIQRNANTLKSKLETLEAARVMYYVSLEQLKIAQNANDVTQQMIAKQRVSILTTLATMIRNACMIERTNELQNMMTGAANMANTLVIHVTKEAVEGLGKAYAASAVPALKPETFMSVLETIADGARKYEAIANDAQTNAAKLQDALKVCMQELQPTLNGNPILNSHFGVAASAGVGTNVPDALNATSTNSDKSDSTLKF